MSISIDMKRDCEDIYAFKAAVKQSQLYSFGVPRSEFSVKARRRDLKKQSQFAGT
jgi:hypothetical protein